MVFGTFEIEHSNLRDLSFTRISGKDLLLVPLHIFTKMDFKCIETK